MRELQEDVRGLLDLEQKLWVLVVCLPVVAAASCGVACPLTVDGLLNVAAVGVKIAAHVHVAELVDNVCQKFSKVSALAHFL